MGVADQIVASRFSSIDLSNKAVERLERWILLVDSKHVLVQATTR